MRSFFTREQNFFLLVSILCFYVIYPFILPLVLGITFAYLFEPILNKLIHYFKLKKVIWKWIISILIIFLTFISILGPILTLITTGIQELSAVLIVMESELKNPMHIDSAAKHISEFLSKFGIEYSIAELIDKGIDFLKKAASLIASNAGTALTATPGYIVKVSVLILTWCFFLIHGKKYRNTVLPKIIPWERERQIVAKTVSSVLKALIVANVLVSCIQAILITTVLVAFGVPRFALLGIIAFFVSFIPVIGTAPVMIGAAAWCYLSEGRVGAAIGILICAVIISFADNVLRPFFMKGGAELSFFWIFLAIVGGMSQFGVSGAVLGPVCFALFVAANKTLDEMRQKTIHEEDVPNP
ncbi:AI-2E family transporter [Fluviispira multicolorata]|uniref:AI-2E family transporter n=1 Tax=Fluviispira multicolorata TaxID=2654512 RepID=UPI00137544AB|nr:AI-2E family transporter [Fluviispira multicolorata]